MTAATSPSKQPQSTPRPALRLIPGLRRRPNISGRMIVIAVVVLLGAFAIQLALSMAIIQDAYRADDLESQQLELEREHTAALEASDAASSPQQLAQQATDLGMVPSTGNSYLDLATSQIVDSGNGAPAQASPIDPSLVPNQVLESEESAKDAENADGSGASNTKADEPAVPSEFELSSPSTH